jgi:hypothetical protein
MGVYGEGGSLFPRGKLTPQHRVLLALVLSTPRVLVRIKWPNEDYFVAPAGHP